MRGRALVVATTMAIGLTASSAQAAGLTPERFGVLDPALALLVKADKTKSDAKGLAKAKQACTLLEGSSDPLIVSKHDYCATEIALQPDLDAITHPCEQAARSRLRACLLRLSRRGSRAARRYALAARKDRDTVIRQVDDVACRHALWTTKEELRQLDLAARAFDLLGAAIRHDSGRALNHAERLLDKLDADTRSPSQQLKEFRQACRPA